MTRTMTAADDAALAVITATADRLQQARGYDTRHTLHQAVMAELETVYDDEGLIDAAVYDYCASENARGDERTFTDMKP